MLCATRGEREERLSPLYALFSPLYPLFLRLAKIELPLFKNYGMTQRCIEEGPRRGHTCITAGLDPRNMHICKGTTSKMSHITMNQADELGYWLLCVPLGDEGIYQSFYSAGQDLRFFLRFSYESVSYVAERCTCDLFEVIVPSAI